MEATIDTIRHNPLMERSKVSVNLEHHGEPTPSEEEVVDRLAAEEDWNRDEMEIESIKTGFGSQESTATVRLTVEIELDRYEDKVEENDVEPVSTGSDEGVDYSKIVSGTISEAKERLNEMEDPDYSEALEAEKADKDRKTLRQWLESQKE